MMRSLWIAKTGLDAHQTSMDVITSNLANVSTTGFKRSRPVFEDLLYQTLRQPGAASSQASTVPSGLTLGTGVRVVATEHIFTQGTVQKTDNPLDLAIQGNGFFQIQMPDGSLAYTRDGSFTKDANGLIVTANGYPLSPPITIPANALSVTISPDGVVTYSQPGNNAPQPGGNIQLVGFVNNAGLQSSGQNLFVETASSGTGTPTTPGTNGTGLINQGYVETSNVNVAEELVNMIVAQRGYEMNSKAVTTCDQMLSRLTQI
jgi:flagellar basal-body rod protein FlgG